MKIVKNNASPVWSMEPDEVVDFFRTSKDGLSEEEATKRAEQSGTNIFRVHREQRGIEIFLHQFASPLLFVLLGAAVLTIILGHWLDASVILFAVAVNVGLGFRREYHAEHTLERLMTYIKERTRVIRSGVVREIDATLLVPGDVIELTYGARVPADARLISTNSLRIDESVLTGEALPVGKGLEVVSAGVSVAERTNMVFAGTLVVEGHGSAIISATGSATEIGKIATAVSATRRVATPIERSLSHIAWIVAFAVGIIVVIIFFSGLLHGYAFTEMLVLSAAVAVGAVPEALPIALTVTLSAGAERIAKRKSIVRTLSAAETLGSVTTIMTDKTGTLTLSDMRLVDIVTPEHITDVLGGKPMESITSVQQKILDLASQCCDVVIEADDGDEDSWRYMGRPLEIGVIKAAQSLKVLPDDFFDERRQAVIPFNSTNKFSVWEQGHSMVCMGAPDILLARSSMSKERFMQVEQFMQAASEAGMRLVGIATMPRPEHKKNQSFSIDMAHDLTFEGVLVFRDPVRDSVPGAIKKITSHGIRVVIVTGDLKGTAVAVARELGWSVSEGEALSGQELRQLSDEALLEVLPRIKVFARVTPEDKMRIGTLLRKLGEVVAMTGDGVNDAPSLKAMDVGVALGSGSDVAKSAADIVLLDDNFETIVEAVREGRKILANIRKTFVYLFSTCLDEVVLVGGSILLGFATPITALQIIGVNLFTGSLPAIAFAYDDDHDNERAGIHSLKTLINKEVRVLTFGIGVFSSLALFLLYMILLRVGVAGEIARSVVFICFATYILAASYSFRSLRKPLFTYPLFTNRTLNVGIIIAGSIIIAMATISPLQRMFSLVPLSLGWWGFIVLWLILNVCIVEIAKWFFRHHR
jgi:Ca2+-transporting ATPase